MIPSMKKRQRHASPDPLEVQESPDVPAEAPPRKDPDEGYSLEDIIQEFGGWSRPAPDPPAPPPAPPERSQTVPPAEPEPPRPETPSQPEPPPEPEPPPKPPSRFHFVLMDSSGRSKPLDAPRTEEPSPLRDAPNGQAPTARTPERPARPPARHRKAEREQAAKEEPPSPDIRDVCRSLGKRAKGLRLRLHLCWSWAALAIVLTALCHWEIPLGPLALTRALTGRLLAGLLLAGALTAWDVMVSGLYQLLRLRPALDTLLVLCTVVFAFDSFARIADGTRLPYAAVLLPGFCFALWGRVLGNRARLRCLKTVLAMPEQPRAAVLARRSWGNRDCIFRGRGERERYLEDLDGPSLVDRVMEIYVPAVLLLSLVLSLLMALLNERDFLLAWSAILAGSLPLAGFITWWRPFASLSARLSQVGTALCGWRGAKELSKPCCLAVTDTDLFPPGSIKLTGIKLFGRHDIRHVAGYAYATVRESGSGLEPVFRKILADQNGISCAVDAFRRYEGGGYGAEIQGEVVLIGSLAFMRGMAVRMAEGTNLQRALYCAVNGELAAVFSLQYASSPTVHAGLETALRAKHLTLLLTTRDFRLTPEMVGRRYKLPAKSFEYPSVEERARLSGPQAAAEGVQMALLARDSFLSLSESASGAQALCASVQATLAVDLSGGGIGFLITTLLAWSGGFASLNAVNLMLYCLLWTFPALVLSITTRR